MPGILFVVCGVVVVAVVAAVIGLVSARSAASGSSVPTLRPPMSVAGIEVSLPSGWHVGRAARRTAPLGLTDGLAAVSGVDLIAVGRATTTDPTLLPANLLALLAKTPRGQLVTFRGATFYRYLNLRLRGTARAESVYAVPTAAGTVLAMCQTPKPNGVLASTCERVVESIRPSSGTLAPGLLPAYGSALSAAVNTLNAARAVWGGRLSAARTARGQALAATQLAAAHAQAAAALGALNAGPASSANAALAAALNTEAAAYTRLAGAAVHRRSRRYQSAAAAVAAASDAINSAVAALRAFGYAVG